MPSKTLFAPKNLKPLAIEAALKAGKILSRYFGKNVSFREKPGAGVVTQADEEAQEATIKILKRAGSSFGFLAEEDTKNALLDPAQPGRWIIDPLDGTTNFLHGYPAFCVSIAGEFQGKVLVGVIYHPVLKELYVAERGKGSTLNGKRIRVSKTPQLSTSLLATGFGYQREESSLHNEIVTFERLSKISRAIRRPGSAALDLAYTARGVFDGYWERGLNPWDVAAGALLVQEAGGRVTDYENNDYATPMRDLVAGGPKLHPTLLQVVNPSYCRIDP